MFVFVSVKLKALRSPEHLLWRMQPNNGSPSRVVRFRFQISIKSYIRAAAFTKANVIDYYVRVAPFLLPHLKNRPVTLKRFPEGVYGEFFYEKDAPSFTPQWVKTFPVPRRNKAEPEIRYILINNLPTLVWLANLANLEIHPFLHRVPKLDRPTAMVFDCDPGEGADVLTCARVALMLRDVLRELKLESFAKVSGSKGLQVYVPFNSAVTYDVTQPFAKALAGLLAERAPNRDWVKGAASAKEKGRVISIADCN